MITKHGISKRDVFEQIRYCGNILADGQMPPDHKGEALSQGEHTYPQ